MFVHRLLSKKLSIGSKKSLNILKKFSLNNHNDISTTTSDYSSNFKEDTPEQPGASLLHIKRALKLANTEFQDGITNLKTGCPACDSCEEGKKPNDIFINKTTGYFMCPNCRYGGRVGLIEKFFTTSPRSPKTINDLKTYQRIFLTAKEQYLKDKNEFDYLSYELDYQPVTEQNVEEICRQFEIDEQISRNSLIVLNARYNSTKMELLFPLTDILGKVVGCKIISKSLQEDGEWKEICYPEHNCSGLVIHNNSKPTSKGKEPTTKAIVVLNMLDFLALMTTKINANFICLPYGLKLLPQECLPLLDQFSELTLWFNFNTAGWDVARNFAKKLDEKRCKFVRPTSSQPTPYKALQDHIDIRGIYNKSQPILHKAITTFTSLRQDVLSDLQNIDKVQGVKWKRFPTLNKYLKGHRKGELTLLTGPTGSGKTTFISDYSLDLAMQGVTTLWGSFEIRNTRLATTLLRQFAGKQLLETPTDENLFEFDSYANLFEELPIYFMTFHGEQQIKVVMEAIEHAQYVHDINHVIIDNVQFMMGMADESKHIDRFWKQDVIIAAFRAFATKKNCHVTLVIHPRKEKDSEDLTTSSIFGGAKATQEADNVLIIQDKRLTTVRGKKYLQIAKNRYSGDLGIMPMEFDKQSLSYAQKQKKKDEPPQESPT